MAAAEQKQQRRARSMMAAEVCARVRVVGQKVLRIREGVGLMVLVEPVHVDLAQQISSLNQ